MVNHNEHAQLIKQAHLGDKESLNRLAEIARIYLNEYVLRLTLKKDLTQDIVQESILEMFKVFHKLKNTDRFWSWLDGIAFNKIRSHYGRQWRHKTISLSDIDGELTTDDSQSALAETINQELKQIVLKSMQQLSPRHRAILTMRCYKGMPYSEIAASMGCTTFGAQSLFYRAKKSLAKKLARHGLGKGCLLTSLVIFGKLTAATEAAAAEVCVTAASIKVGTTVALVGALTSKTAVVSLAAAGVIAGGSMVVTQGNAGINNGTQNFNTEILINSQQENDATNTMQQSWHYFPEGTGKPVMMRLLKFNDSGQNPYCQYLQNQHTNYFYDKGIVSINNYRFYNQDMSVRRLPTDDKDLIDSLTRVEGIRPDIEYISSKRKGLLVISGFVNNDSDKIRMIDRHTNVLEEEYFQYDWPQSAKVVDNRDPMHKRGWTYFKIVGQINGKRISGTGRLPFIYDTSKKYGPWLQLRLTDGSKIVDTTKEARVFNVNGKTLATYKAGSFFNGLSRPWMGLHTIDTVRRDAARKSVWFETKLLQGSNKAQVDFTYESVRLVYTIDMEMDVIESISFSTDTGEAGQLDFTYLQHIDDAGNEFTQPTVSGRVSQEDSPGMLWLVELINGRW